MSTPGKGNCLGRLLAWEWRQATERKRKDARRRATVRPEKRSRWGDLIIVREAGDNARQIATFCCEQRIMKKTIDS